MGAIEGRKLATKDYLFVFVVVLVFVVVVVVVVVVVLVFVVVVLVFVVVVVVVVVLVVVVVFSCFRCCCSCCSCSLHNMMTNYFRGNFPKHLCRAQQMQSSTQELSLAYQLHSARARLKKSFPCPDRLGAATQAEASRAPTQVVIDAVRHLALSLMLTWLLRSTDHLGLGIRFM